MISLFDIRAWDGSQHRAWEELTYQVRVPPPSRVVETRKTRAPDGGVEWYWVFDDGHEEGFQAKFYGDLASAVGDMARSVRSVATQRPRMSRLTFVVPFDFTDQPATRAKSDQRRWDEAIARWAIEIPGADRLTFAVIRGGDVLSELTRDINGGRRAFWFGDVGLTVDWLERRWDEARTIVGERYTPQAHTVVALESDIHAVCLSDQYIRRLDVLVTYACDELLEVAPFWRDGSPDVLELVRGIQDAQEALHARHPAFDPHELFQAVTTTLQRIADLLLVLSSDDQFERYQLGRAQSRLQTLHSFLRTETGSAETRLLAIVGPAGQGKTHTILQSARELLDLGVPTLVLLGQRFDAGPWWGTTSAQLGGIVAGAEEFFGALDAMCEASGVRGLVVVDALNESQRPSSWKTELQSLISHIKNLTWLSLVVTWREDYTAVIGPPSDLPIHHHRGLAGVETEALHRYCDLYGIPIPKVSMFDPAFSNPLFLRMFCEVRAKDPSAGEGSSGRSQLFARFADMRAKEVLDRLRLNPNSNVVLRGLIILADAMIRCGEAGVLRADIEGTIDTLVRERDQWPDTLFAALRSEGLVETTPSWDGTETVTFPFQAFSEHLVVSRLLDKETLGSPELAAAAIAAIRARPRFWRSAAVLLPERYGIELIDALGDTDEGWRLRDVTISSLADRDANSFGARALELLDIALRDSTRHGREVAFALAPRLNHPANGDWLHTHLMATPMPDRDASWGIAIFDVLDGSAAYGRLLAWAVGGDSRSSDRQIVLASVPLAWALISSNRRLRDHTTKALVELFRNHLGAFASLLRMFESVDDAYVKERLLAIAYGSIMRGGDQDLAGAQAVAMEVARWFREGHVPVNVVARDSGRGSIAWAVSRKLVSASLAVESSPPYGAAPPTEPPTSDELKAAHGYTDTEPREWRAFAILNSCLDWMGDFNKYVIKCEVGHFSWYPLNGPRPTQRKHSDPLGEVEADWAGRWVATRAIEIGWTPERFEAFERSADLTFGRDAHKPERVGKKYQWLALHELLARMADNFHPAVDWDGQFTPYAGPWAWFGRDIDPSIAVSVVEDDQYVSRIGLDAEVTRWVPVGPDMEVNQTPLQWSSDIGHFPAVADLVRPFTDEAGSWVALYRHSEWRRRTREGRRWDWDRQQWVLQFSWLAWAGTGQVLFEMLEQNSLFGRWMPERDRPYRAYLGEGPWSPLDQAELPIWVGASRPFDSEGAVLVLPATERYLWEGITQDCSIDDSLAFQVPTATLLGGARWEGTQPSWSEGDAMIARALRTPDGANEHSVLLAEENWLEHRLEELRLDLVVGVLGERQAMGPEGDLDLRAWTELTSVGLLIPGTAWQFAGARVDIHSRGAE